MWSAVQNSRPTSGKRSTNIQHLNKIAIVSPEFEIILKSVKNIDKILGGQFPRVDFLMSKEIRGYVLQVSHVSIQKQMNKTQEQ